MQSKAKTFLNQIAKDVLPDNFHCRFYSNELSEEDFSLIQKDDQFFWNYTKQLLLKICTKKFADEKCHQKIENISKPYIETNKSGFISSYTFALWFMKFDEDNWFSFEQIHKLTRVYFQTKYYKNRLELKLIKGFKNKGVLSNNTTVVDLPIVLDYENKVLTIWAAELYD